jgi:hypothetical protein
MGGPNNPAIHPDYTGSSAQRQMPYSRCWLQDYNSTSAEKSKKNRVNSENFPKREPSARV